MALRDDVSPIVIAFQMGRKVNTAGATATGGYRCLYFTAFETAATGAGFADNDFYWGSGNPDAMIQMARTASGANTIQEWNNNRQTLHQTYFEAKHKIHNTSTGRIFVTGYLCETRRDMGRSGIGAAVILGTNVARYPRTILGQGFAANGFDPTTATTNNLGVFAPELTPFNSGKFCETYKILAIKKRRIDPGDYAVWTTKDSRTFRVRPEDYQNEAASTTIWNDMWALTAQTLYEHKKGEKFWFFRAETGTSGEEVDIDSNLTMSPQEMHIVTNIKWEGRVSLNAQSATMYVNNAFGFLNDPGVGNVDIINNETEEKNVVENL